MPPSDGKFASTVQVGAKGQIVIPKKARDLFGIKPGDTLLLLADVEKGIAIVRPDFFEQFKELPPGLQAMSAKPPTSGTVEKINRKDVREEEER